MHALLARQIKRFFGEEGLPLSENYQAFLQAIDEAYRAADTEGEMIGRTLDLMSSELRERNQRLMTELNEKNKIESSLLEKNDQLRAVVAQLEAAQMQLLQADKMASIGQLAAGVAHEINNPIGYVHSNLSSLQTYLDDLFKILKLYDSNQQQLAAREIEALKKLREEIDYAYLIEDIPLLMQQSREGISRVQKIVTDLREFSHASTGGMQASDLHQGIRSTLNIVQNEFKNKAEVVLSFGDLPLVVCNLGQLNQVFLNLIINACHAIATQGHIFISTGVELQNIWIKITDDGAGIEPQNLPRVFDAFFTTKPVGKGTGLGLSLSYSIIKSHHGSIAVSSVVGEGTTFVVTLPIAQPDVE